MKITRIGLATISFSVLISLAVFNFASALNIPAAPTLEMPILDQTNTLTDNQKDILARQINDERLASSNQIAILIISSLEDESIEEYANRVFRSWGVGTKEKNNGVLLLVAINDRKLRIEVGSGLEGALTDATSNRITRNEITPEFKTGLYYEGIQNGLTAVIEAIHGEYSGGGSNSWSETLNNYLPDILFLFIFLVLSWLGSILGRTKSWWLGGVIGFVLGSIVLVLSGFKIAGFISILILTPIGLLFDRSVSKNYKKRTRSGRNPSWWAGGGSFGGGSSDGGGSFGGGSSSGGGSSGSW